LLSIDGATLFQMPPGVGYAVNTGDHLAQPVTSSDSTSDFQAAGHHGRIFQT
jgi:hypothetical protein